VGSGENYHQALPGNAGIDSPRRSKHKLQFVFRVCFPTHPEQLALPAISHSVATLFSPAKLGDINSLISTTARRRK
jgi:hypothetical protein